jgi:ABC-type multidrug transport system ATPase subunit
VELASGYLRPWKGSVTVLGVDAWEPRARKNRRILRSTIALYPAMTVQDHLAFAALSVGENRSALIGRAERLGLSPWFEASASSLSAGTARKLWFIFCTAGSFDLVVLDEPFTGLDELSAKIVCKQIKDWTQDRTVILVDHQRNPIIDSNAICKIDMAAGQL